MLRRRTWAGLPRGARGGFGANEACRGVLHQRGAQRGGIGALTGRRGRGLVHKQPGAYTKWCAYSRCTHKAVRTQGGARKRRSVAIAGVLLLKGPQARWYKHKAMHIKGRL